MHLLEEDSRMMVFVTKPKPEKKKGCSGTHNIPTGSSYSVTS
jgi:hypothetical protein